MDEQQKQRVTRQIAAALVDCAEELSVAAIRELAEINDILRTAGMPPGAEGVRHVANLRAIAHGLATARRDALIDIAAEVQGVGGDTTEAVRAICKRVIGEASGGGVVVDGSVVG